MARLKWQALISLLVMTLSSTMVTTDARTGPLSPALAQLLSFSYDQSELRFDVISNGCTTDANFELEIVDDQELAPAGDSLAPVASSEIVYLRLVQIKADVCRRRPAKQTIVFPVTTLIMDRQIYLANLFLPIAPLKRE